MLNTALDFYSTVAPNFDSFMSRSKVNVVRDYESARLKVGLDLQNQDKVVNLGIGSANDERRMQVSQILDAYSITWIGIDISHAMLHEAKKYDKRILLLEGDIQNFPFVPESISKFLSHHVLGLVRDVQKVLNNICGSLTAGGIYTLAEYVRSANNSVHPHFDMKYPQYRERSLKESGRSLETYRTVDGYLEALRTAGFTVNHVEYVTLDSICIIAQKQRRR